MVLFAAPSAIFFDHLGKRRVPAVAYTGEYFYKWDIRIGRWHRKKKDEKSTQSLKLQLPDFEYCAMIRMLH
jgi:hypothetical protein